MLLVLFTFMLYFFAMKRNYFILLFGLTAFLSVASLYFQFVMHLNPCPLCIAQRIAVFALTTLFFWGIFITKRRPFIINTSLQLFFALFGAGMAGRQIWLIHLPLSDKTGCMPDISVLWNYLPFWDILMVFLNGSGDCLENSWTFLGISMPEWCLGFFVFFIVVAILGFFQKK